MPEITISGGAAVTEGGNARFTLSANPAPTANLTVSFTISEDTSGGQEFLHSTVRDGSFSTEISANQTSATYDVLTLEDSTDEPNGSVTVTLNTRTSYTIGTPSSASVTVNDNDAPTLSISPPSGGRRYEGNSSPNSSNVFNVNLSAPTVVGSVPFRVCFSGTATLDTNGDTSFPPGTDYEVYEAGFLKSSNCVDLSMPSGRTYINNNVGVRINGDTAFEPDETIIATLSLRGSPPPDVSLGTATATYLILNDDPPPYSTTDFITPSANADLTGPEGDRQHFAILRNVVESSGIVPSSNAYGFQLCFTGTARPNVDYSVTNHGNHPLEIDRDGCSKANDGDQGTRRPAGFDRTNFYIHYWRDGETEGDESIIVTLKNAMGTRLYGDDSRKVSYGNSLTFTIKDPAPQPRCEAARSTDSYARSTYPALIDKMCEWSDQAWGERRRNWDRALLAFGVSQPRYSQSACQAERDGDDDRYIRDGLLQDYSCGPMKAEEAQVYADKPWRGWYEEVEGHTVASALRDLESRSPQTEDGTSVGDGDSTKDGNGGDTDNVNAQTDNPPPPPDYGELKTKVRTWAGEQAPGSDHAQRWNRVLAALGDPDAIEDGYSPMTAAEAQTHADKGWTRWDDVVAALTEVESRAAAEAQAEPEPPPPDPELSLSAGSAVDEGASASFTIHADAAPAADLTVSVSVAQSGDWLDSPGAGIRMVTLAAGATTASLDIATVNDSVDEPDGSVSVTLDTGTGYTVASSPNDTASVTVRDDDDPPPAIPIGSCVSVPQWKTVKGYYDANANRSPNYGANWYRVLIAYRRDRGDQTLPVWTGQTAEPTAAYTAEEAENGEKVWRGWTPVRGVLECLERTYGGTSTSSAVGGVPAVGQSGEVGTANPDPSSERNRWNPQTAPGGFEPDAMTDFAAGSCVSPRLRSEAAARAGEAWRGPVHVERWLRVMQTFTGGANDATVVTPAEANFHTAAGRPGWLPVADALRCMEQESLREFMSR